MGSIAKVIDQKTGRVISDRVPYLPDLYRPGQVVSLHHFLEGWSKYRVKRVVKGGQVQVMVSKCWLGW